MTVSLVKRYSGEITVHRSNDECSAGDLRSLWLRCPQIDVATDEVQHLFASSDDDHDDRLSYEEIISNYDTFVGSEATDYGDHLQNIHHLSDEL
uniref:EF-hand domain-containing protein n=1 Tax=Lutzomyia longipalpis TaxID=7200 RepID=A0A1B0CHJ2_LUTLO